MGNKIFDFAKSLAVEGSQQNYCGPIITVVTAKKRLIVDVYVGFERYWCEKFEGLQHGAHTNLIIILTIIIVSFNSFGNIEL